MKKGIKIVCLAAALLFASAAGTFAGYWLGRQHSPAQTGDLSDNGVPSADETQTFYATIREIRGNNWLVEGLSVNDINFRSQFSLSISEETQLVWRGTDKEPSDFAEGDTISVTFAGAVQETYPAGIPHVVKIQLLEDE